MSLFYTRGGVVDSLSYTILVSATKCPKESDLVVTKASNNFGRYSFQNRIWKSKYNSFEI